MPRCLLALAVLAGLFLFQGHQATEGSAFTPTFDVFGLSPATLGAHGNIALQSEIPAGQHLISIATISVPAGWNIADAGSIPDPAPPNPPEAMGNGLASFDNGCNGSPDSYVFDILEGEPDAEIKAHWDANVNPGLSFSFDVEGSAATGHTIVVTMFFNACPFYQAPLTLNLTFFGRTSPGNYVALTNPVSQGMYSWSVTFQSAPLPAEHSYTPPADQVAVGNDSDGDDVPNFVDNCPTTPNGGQENFDGDAFGDACDSDVDGDGVSNAADQCPFTLLTQRPVDANGCPQAQVDWDLDGICNPGRTSSLCTGSDNCPNLANNEQADANGNNIGDACDSADTDGDGGMDSMEYHAGTSRLLACSADSIPNNENPDARLADLNDDRGITGADLSLIAGNVGQSVPPAPARKDIAPEPAGDNSITGADLSRVATAVGTSC